MPISPGQYIAMYGDIGQKSNTMFFSDKPADVNALMAQAATIFKAIPSSLQQQGSTAAPLPDSTVGRSGGGSHRVDSTSLSDDVEEVDSFVRSEDDGRESEKP